MQVEVVLRKGQRLLDRGPYTGAWTEVALAPPPSPGKPHTIPVAEIREIWEAASKKGRYTNKAIWAACAKELEEYQAMAAAQSSQHK